MTPATCNSCGKVWQVPDAAKSYSCKDCGGQVRGQIDCTKCGMANLPDSQFCEKCGEHLGANVDPEAISREDEINRRLANRELGKLKKTIRAIRTIYILSAVVHGVLALGLLLLFAAAPSAQIGIFLAVSVGIFVTLIVGARRITVEPFFWSIAIASLQTINLILGIVENGLAEIPILPTVLCVILWVGASGAARAQKILDANPDFSIKRRSRESFSPNPKSGQSRINRSRKSNRRETLILGGIIGGVTIVALMLGLFITAPPSPQSAAEKLETAWNQNDNVAIGNLFEPTRFHQGSKDLKRDLLRRGWNVQRPKISNPKFGVAKNDMSIAAYEIQDGVIETTWKLSKGEEWQLYKIRLHGFSPSYSPDSSIRKFKDAWSRSELEGMVDSFAEESKSKGKKYLRKRFNQPGWNDNPPMLTSETLTEIHAERIQVIFLTEYFPVVSTWEYRHPNWKIVKLKVPR